jgi:hypothetical protein
MSVRTRTPGLLAASLLRLREQESNPQRVVDGYACCLYTIPDHALGILMDGLNPRETRPKTCRCSQTFVCIRDPPVGLEPTTSTLVWWRSIQLSYGGTGVR